MTIGKRFEFQWNSRRIKLGCKTKKAEIVGRLGLKWGALRADVEGVCVSANELMVSEEWESYASFGGHAALLTKGNPCVAARSAVKFLPTFNR